MTYTSYYANLIKAQGLPNLNLEQHQRLFNIVVLESQITEISKWKPHLDCYESKKMAHNREHRLIVKLYNLTGNRQPEMLLKEMAERSH